MGSIIDPQESTIDLQMYLFVMYINSINLTDAVKTEYIVYHITEEQSPTPVINPFQSKTTLFSQKY